VTKRTPLVKKDLKKSEKNMKKSLRHAWFCCTMVERRGRADFVTKTWFLVILFSCIFASFAVMKSVTNPWRLVTLIAC